MWTLLHQPAPPATGIHTSPPCQLGFDILRGQPDKLTKAIDSLLRNAYAGQLLAELLPCPPGDRLLVLPADIVAVIPQQPRFLMLFQRQQSRRQLAVEYSTGRTRAIDEPLARDWLPLIGGPSGLTIFALPRYKLSSGHGCAP